MISFARNIFTRTNGAVKWGSPVGSSSTAKKMIVLSTYNRAAAARKATLGCRVAAHDRIVAEDIAPTTLAVADNDFLAWGRVFDRRVTALFFTTILNGSHDFSLKRFVLA